MRQKAAILAILLISAGILFTYKQNCVVRKAGVIMVEQGNGLSKISTMLEENHFIDSAILFKVYAFITGQYNKKIKFGEYEITTSDSFQSILTRMINGAVMMHKITIPEGLLTKEIIDIINSSDVLSGNKITWTEEGSLMPDTYLVYRNMKREELFAKMRDDMTNFVATEWELRDNDLPFKTMQEAMIMASIVEKETSLPSERALIAAVYINRLKIGMRLQADPTTIYEVTKGQCVLERPLSRSDLKKSGKYNTYTFSGLPCGPIANPGRDSIVATLHPAKTKDLYFVANGYNGGHYFSKTYEEHLKNVQKYRNSKTNNDNEE